MKSRTAGAIASALLLLALLGFLGSVWWWALFGMSRDVGIAWMCTVFGSGIAGGAATMAAGELRRTEATR